MTREKPMTMMFGGGHRIARAVTLAANLITKRYVESNFSARMGREGCNKTKVEETAGKKKRNPSEIKKR